MIFTLLCLLAALPAAADKAVQIPGNDRESIRFWRQYQVTAASDKRVALAHRVFRQLLRSWDRQRLAPSLYVVRSTDGPWAASLDDGSILLSYDALQLCFKEGVAAGKSRLAFVLAHEIAHQDADDLWHRRFFRLAGTQAPGVKKRILRGLGKQKMDYRTLARKEARADQWAITRMVMAGYDPMYIAGDRDFFRTWVESVWGASCKSANSQGQVACKEARSRAERVRARLQQLSARAAFFELGVQYYVLGDYRRARDYFTALGRDFPGSAVYMNIGLSWLAEALQQRRELEELGLVPVASFYFPLLLAADTMLDAIDASGSGHGVRGGQRPLTPETREKLVQIRRKTGQAADAFEKAIRLAPGNRHAYINLVVAYIAAGNMPMAEGILIGKYEQRFGRDDMSRILSALIGARKGSYKKAELVLRKVRDRRAGKAGYTFLVAAWNLGVVRQMAGNRQGAEQAWQYLSRRVKVSASPALRHMARENKRDIVGISKRMLVAGLKPGDSVDKSMLPAGAVAYRLHKQGVSYSYYRLPDGSRIIADDQGKVISIASVKPVTELPGNNLKDVLSKLGMPAIRVESSRGVYLGWPAQGLLVRFQQDRVQGWSRLGPR